MTSWHAGLQRRVVEIECSDETHQIMWRRGRLALLNHTSDIEGERALEALAGEPVACLGVFGAWQEMMETGRRQLEDVSRATRAIGGADLRFLHRFKSRVGDLNEIAELAIVAGAERRLSREATGTLTIRELDPLITSRANPELKASFQATKDRRRPVRLKLGCRVVVSDEPVEVLADGSPGRLSLVVGLPIRWLTRVWGQGLARIGNSVVLDSLGHGDLRSVVVLDWQVDKSAVMPEVRRMWVQRSGDRWMESDVEGGQQVPMPFTDLRWRNRG